jgi:hypothetical protein
MTGSGARPDGAPPRRRTPWSFKTIVEDVGGRPLADFQDPPPRTASMTISSPPVSVPRAAPNLPPSSHAPAIPADAPSSPPGEPGAGVVVLPAAIAEPLEGTDDPVARVYPPLSGSTGRSLHGVEAEHHLPTLESVRSPEEWEPTTTRRRGPGPSRRPERIYLHYLLLHLDRLHDGGLRYLKRAVDEELAHRETSDALE